MFHKATFDTKNIADLFVNLCFTSGFCDLTVIQSVLVKRVSVLVYWQTADELKRIIDLQKEVIAFRSIQAVKQ